MSDVRDLARSVAPSEPSSLILHVATVTAVNRSANTYTITVGGASVAGVPAYRNVYAVVGDVVEVLLDGPSPRIVGVVGVPTWHVVGAASEPAYQNGWSDYAAVDATVQSPRFCRDGQGWVHLEGIAKKGSLNSIIFTLPAGYRPAHTQQFACTQNDAFGEIAVDSSGNVTGYLGTANTGWQSLSTVHFWAAA